MAMTPERAEGRFRRVSRTVLPVSVAVILAGCASSPRTDSPIASDSRSPSGQVSSGAPLPEASVSVASENGVVITYEGRRLDGKFTGQMTVQFPDGSVGDGPVVAGQRYGYWTERFADGSVQEGRYVGNRRHGRWILKYRDGRVQEGPFVAGKRHGEWTLTSSRGVLFHGPYVDGQRHGLWTLIFPNSNPHHVTFVNGARR